MIRPRKALREKRRLTQAAPAEKLNVSDKAVSKLETGKGYPDISLLEPLAAALGVSLTELLAGSAVENANVSANMLRSHFYVCPVCGNVLHSMGAAAVSCHGIALPPLEAEEAGEAICYACACPHPDKADAIYRLIARGLSMTDGTKAIYYLQDSSVSLVMKLRQKAWHEAHRMLGFLRFEELSGGVLYAQMEPPYAVLPLIAPHFADRLRQENWIIHDLKRGLLALHRAGGWWVLMDDQELNREFLAGRAEREEEFQMLWRTFCRTIAIEERRNPRCQQTLLPCRFRPHMNEFQTAGENNR